MISLTRQAGTQTAFAMLVILLFVSARVSVARGPGTSDRTEITLFPGWGWVLENRTADLRSGRNEVTFPGIARQLDPGSLLIEVDGALVSMRTRTEPQGWERIFGDLSGKPIRMISESGELVEGEVVSFGRGRLYLRRDDGSFILIPNPQNYRLELTSLPDADKPGVLLDVVVDTDRAGSYPIRIFYVANGLSWALDYTVVLNEAENKATLTGLAQIRNNSGTAWENARVRLVAGEMRMSPGRAPHLREAGMERSAVRVRSEATPDAERYADHFVYQVPGRVNLSGDERYQFPLIAAGSADVSKIYRFEVRPFSGTSEKPRRLDIVYAFRNTEAGGLGDPMPAGTARVYRKTGGAETGWPDPGFEGAAREMPSSGGMQLVGQDRIAQVAKGDRFELITGRAFDVRAVVSVDRQEQLAPGVREESRTITLKNEKEEKVTATVVVPLHRNLTVVNESHRPEIETADRRVYEIEVPAEGESALRITIRQSH